MSEEMNVGVEPRVSLLLAVIDTLKNNPEYEARAYVGDYEEKDDDLEWFKDLILKAVGPDVDVIPERQEYGTIYRFVRTDHA